MTATGDTDRNFETCRHLAQEAVRRKCSMMFLPECCTFIGRNREETLAAAQPLEGPLMARYRGLARETGLWLSLGGFQETGPDAAHTHNTHVVLDARGDTVAAYRKVHLFDVDQSAQGGPVLKESRGTAPGRELVACDSPIGRLGLSVCYDLRFPAVYQELVYGRGAEILLVPSAFTVRTGAAHWHVLLRARAIETQTYVLAAAQVGRHNETRESYGHTLAVNPWGDIVGEVAEPVTGITVVRIDRGELQRRSISLV
ncbi:hypothetical protein WJX81_004325 [Elliptochloris bilobata]|uniref:CN hydrolase domain-containing protein n=1 Tax=Elliptochloris bilobata TaxID=381761 RepID=A0AAW1S9R1_9CHLO